MSFPIGPNTNLHLDAAAKTAGLSHQVNFANAQHDLGASASINQQLMKGGATTIGGSAAYTHVPSGSQLSVAGSHTSRGGGGSLSAAGTLNLHQSSNTRLDAVGNASRHFPSGVQSAGVGLQFGTAAGSGINAGVQHTNMGMGNVRSVGANVNLAPGVNAYAQRQHSKFGKNNEFGLTVQKRF